MTFREKFQRKPAVRNLHDSRQYGEVSLRLTEVDVLIQKHKRRTVLRRSERIQLINALESATKVIQHDEKRSKYFIKHVYSKREQLFVDIEAVLDQSLMNHDFELITVGCNFMYHAFGKKYLEDYKLNIDLSASLSGMPRFNISNGSELY